MCSTLPPPPSSLVSICPPAHSKAFTFPLDSRIPPGRHVWSFGRLVACLFGCFIGCLDGLLVGWFVALGLAWLGGSCFWSDFGLVGWSLAVCLEASWWAPRRPEDGQKAAQDDPTTAQEGPKTGEVPLLPPRPPKRFPRRPEDASGQPKRFPGWSGYVPRPPRRPRTAQEAPIRPQDRPNTSPRRPKRAS